MAIEVFNRMEIKYLISDEDKNELLSIIGNYMNADAYNINGKPYSIANLYLDSPSNELIIKSLEKPVFKEKIRLRSYGKAELTDTVYLESKKKYNSLVNKRRTPFILQEAYDYINSGKLPEEAYLISKSPQSSESGCAKLNRQVFQEIDYIFRLYKLVPKVYISYDRLAFFEKDNSDFRLTLDNNIQTRRYNLRLDLPPEGTQLLPPGQWLMEAKAFNAFPMWFAKFLSQHRIFSTSFSKYGTEYTNYIASKAETQNNVK